MLGDLNKIKPKAVKAPEPEKKPKSSTSHVGMLALELEPGETPENLHARIVAAAIKNGLPEEYAKKLADKVIKSFKDKLDQDEDEGDDDE